MHNPQIPASQILIENKFDELIINNQLKSCLKEMQMIDMTPIQSRCIPHLLEGKDLLGAAKTGSGKTLAFLVPLIEKIVKYNVKLDHGTLAIILSPTRELSMQIFKVLEQLIIGTNIHAGVVIGGNNREEEANYLRKGVTVLVATPGRLLDHLNSTKPFKFSLLHTLIIDEADRLMNQGFLEEMRAIIKKLPKQRQTVLFSATLNVTPAKLKKHMKIVNDVSVVKSKKKLSIEDKVLTLACLSLKDSCICVDMSLKDSLTKMINSKTETSTVEQLTQKYIVCDAADRFKILYTLIKRNQDKKIMIFMSTCFEVQFYYKFFQCIVQENSTESPIRALHGKQKQKKREENFEMFQEKEHIILLCTDIAARGLDIPQVDLVVQYDPPDDHKEYIHRVGRTARAGKSGQAIIFLRTHEMDFLSVLRAEKIPITGLDFGNNDDILPIQEPFEKIVKSVGALREMAEEGFKSVVCAYVNNPIKSFDINHLDLSALSKNFGLVKTPHVVIKSNKLTKNKKPQKRQAGSKIDCVPSKNRKSK